MASILIRANEGTDHGFGAPAWNKNGTLRPGFAKGKHEPFADYAYYVRWTEGGKRKTQCLGSDPAVAIAAVQEKESGVRLAEGKPASTAPVPEDGRRTIASVTAAWLLWAKAQRSCRASGI